MARILKRCAVLQIFFMYWRGANARHLMRIGKLHSLIYHVDHILCIAWIKHPRSGQSGKPMRQNRQACLHCRRGIAGFGYFNEAGSSRQVARVSNPEKHQLISKNIPGLDRQFRAYAGWISTCQSDWRAGHFVIICASWRRFSRYPAAKLSNLLLRSPVRIASRFCDV